MTPESPPPLGVLAVAPIVVAAAAALLLPGVWPAAAAAAALSAGVWAAFSRRGRGVIPQGALKPVWLLFPVAAATTLAAAMPRAGSGAGAFASVFLAAQALLLLGPPSAWSIRGAITGSAVVAATLVLRLEDRRLLGPVLAYAAALVASLAALERESATTDSERREPGTRRIVAPRGRGRGGLSFAGLAALWVLGLPLGCTLSAALPASPSEKSEDERDRPPLADSGPQAPAQGGSRPITPRAGEEPDRTQAGDDWLSGARTKMRLGFVDTVKLDPRPALLVRVGDGEPSEGVFLMRGLSYDTFDGREWGRSKDVEREVSRAEPGRWLTVASDPSGVALVRLAVTDLRGQGAGHLFLRAEPERVRLDPRSRGVRLRAVADGTVYSMQGLDPGAVYLEDARDPQPSVARVAASESTSLSVPFQGCAASPPDAAVLARLARDAVGTEARPAVRAARIAEWLAARCTYVLSAPELKGASRPVLEFLTRAKRGSCEYFASAETLMLRALGHPARLTVGYRRGDRLGDGTYSFRGTHAHAWTELWLDDVGWWPIDATPPDALAADAQPSDEGDGAERTALERFLDGLQAILSRAVPLLPWALGILLLLVVVARRRAGTGAGAWPGAAGGGAPKGPYARVLAALRSAGVPRRPPWTPKEFEEVARPAVPPAAAALASLTRGFERERYGGRALDAAERDRMEREADEVVRAAKEHRRDGDRPGRSRAPKSP